MILWIEIFKLQKISHGNCGTGQNESNSNGMGFGTEGKRVGSGAHRKGVNREMIKLWRHVFLVKEVGDSCPCMPGQTHLYLFICFTIWFSCAQILAIGHVLLAIIRRL